jgi:hypothetical protein
MQGSFFSWNGRTSFALCTKSSLYHSIENILFSKQNNLLAPGTDETMLAEYFGTIGLLKVWGLVR